MTTIAEIKDQAEPLIKKMRDTGLQVQIYAKPVISKEALAMSAMNNIIRIWPGTSDLTIIDADKKHKQVILRSLEKKRSFEHKFADARVYSTSKKALADLFARSARMTFNLNTTTDKVELVNFKLSRKKESHRAFGSNEIEEVENDYASATVKITRPATDMSFLIGFDENAQFISQLPKTVKSVEEAHDILRPKGVPSDAVRQGEWFFVEATEDEVELICKRSKSYFGHGNDIGDTTHRATCVIETNSQIFVSGLVWDSRSENRHEEIFLDGWFKAIRNNEVVNRDITNATTIRYAD